MSTKFDKSINKKISETNVSPSNNVWDKIEAELDKKENKKILILPFWSSNIFKQAIAASFIFLLGGFSANFFFGNTDSTQAISSQQVEKNIQNNDSYKKNTGNTTTSILASKIDSKTETDVLSTTAHTNLKTNSTINNSLASVVKKKSIIGNYIATIFSSKADHSASKNQKQYTSASDYNWVYDKNTNTFQVNLKEENNNSIGSTSNNKLFINNGSNNFFFSTKENNKKAENIDSEIKESTSMMSLIEKEEKEAKETLELTQEEDSYKQFKSKVSKLNYQGLWLGPNVGYESVFAGGRHYPGGSFGIDVGYDFGGSLGLQTGLRYAINSKIINEYNDNNSTEDYKSEFNSIHIPLLLRYKFTKLTQSYSKPLSLNLLAGMDYSFVDRKNLHQLGLVAGAEYDIFTQADLMFTLGLKGGLYNNLNLNKLSIPEKLTRYNYGLNAYLSVRFIDWAKKRPK